MRRKLPDNVIREKSRHGKIVYYYRVGKGLRTRLPDFGTDIFAAALEDAKNGIKPRVNATTSKPRVGSLRFVVEKYKDDGGFQNLAKITQSNRNAIFAQMCGNAGHIQIEKITKQHIIEGRNDRNKGAGHAANSYLKAIRPLFNFALEQGYIQLDPCIGVKPVKTAAGGYHTWTLPEVQKFEQRHPLGTVPSLALRILLYTGARREDAMRIGAQHVKNGILEFRPMKTRASTGVSVTIGVLPPLQEAINATKTGDMVWLTSGLGRPFKSAASFGGWFMERCVEAGVPGRAHGLRKAGATLAAENGATVHQLMAMYGWTTIGQAEVYTRTADRKKLAIEASKLLLRTDNLK